jgi:hypothetical protein
MKGLKIMTEMNDLIKELEKQEETFEDKIKAIETDKDYFQLLLQCTCKEDYVNMLQGPAKTSALRFYTTYIQMCAYLDREEFRSDVKQKHYYLSTFLKDEMIVKSAKAGKAQQIQLHKYCLQSLTGLGFLVEDKSLAFNLTPLDREIWTLKFKLNSENMRNAQIYYYNNKYDLNIPMNDEKKVVPDEETFDNNFTQVNILKLTN